MWQIWWHVIIPELRPIIEFSTVITTIGLLTSMFGLIYVLTGGGPGTATTVPEYLIWSAQGRLNQPAYAAALSIILFVITGHSRLAADSHHVAQRQSLRAAVAGAGKRQRLGSEDRGDPDGIAGVELPLPDVLRGQQRAQDPARLPAGPLRSGPAPDVRQLRAGLDAFAPRPVFPQFGDRDGGRGLAPDGRLVPGRLRPGGRCAFPIGASCSW